MEDLETRVSVLQSHLDTMVACVQKNDTLLKQFQSLETRLLTLGTLSELIEHVLEDARIAFELANCWLLLCDPDESIRKFLQEAGFRGHDYPELIWSDDPEGLQKSFGRTGQIILGPGSLCLSSVSALESVAPPESVALIPLHRRGAYLGCLVLGGENRERFAPGMATDFLQRLGHVLAVCVENTLHYEQLRRTSLHDTLTGVNNRRFYEQRLEEELSRAVRQGDALSCLFLDIDYFKRINDTWGHQIGDQALIHVAGLIRDQLRGTDVLARYGGEEFVALLPTASEKKALEVAERIRRVVEVVPLSMGDQEPLAMTLSAGVSTFLPGDPVGGQPISGSVLVHAADQALYKAKKGGRNRVISGGILKGESVSVSAG